MLETIHEKRVKVVTTTTLSFSLIFFLSLSRKKTCRESFTLTECEIFTLNRLHHSSLLSSLCSISSSSLPSSHSHSQCSSNRTRFTMWNFFFFFLDSTSVFISGSISWFHFSLQVSVFLNGYWIKILFCFLITISHSYLGTLWCLFAFLLLLCVLPWTWFLLHGEMEPVGFAFVLSFSPIAWPNLFEQWKALISKLILENVLSLIC